MSIQVIKMSNGEEIIAKVSSGDKGYIVATQARSVRMMPDGKGGAQLGLIPFVILNPDGSIPLNENLIVGRAPATNEVEKLYLSEVSGIQLSIS